jgi:hypothetical protein
VRLAGGKAVMTVMEPRMYSILTMPGVSEHELKLGPKGEGLRAFAFTFTSCVAT